MLKYSVSSSNVIRFSIKKLRRIISLFKNKSCKKIFFLLMFYPNKTFKIFYKLINYGVSNLKYKYKIIDSNIYIKDIIVQKKAFLKRLDYKARGQVGTISKPTAKIKINFIAHKE